MKIIANIIFCLVSVEFARRSELQAIAYKTGQEYPESKADYLVVGAVMVCYISLISKEVRSLFYGGMSLIGLLTGSLFLGAGIGLQSYLRRNMIPDNPSNDKKLKEQLQVEQTILIGGGIVLLSTVSFCLLKEEFFNWRNFDRSFLESASNSAAKVPDFIGQYFKGRLTR